MQNLITGLILLTFVSILYLIFLTKKDYKRFKKGIKKSLRVLFQNSIRLFAIFLIISLLQNFLSKETVGNFLLNFKGIKGIIAGEIAGSIMMGPVASGYPIAKYLFDNGASVSLVSSFLLSWVMIGIISLTIEFKELGKKFTIIRNILSIIGIIIISILMEILLWKILLKNIILR